MTGFTKAIFFLLLLQQISYHLFGQDQDLPVFKEISHPFMPAITSEYFYFSEDGLMWFSTAQGLASFDGSEVVYHSTIQEANNLGLNRINAIEEDKEHNLYIATSGIYLFNRKTKTYTKIRYQFPGSKDPVEFTGTSLLIDKSGMVYIGLAGRGMLIYDPVLKKTEHINLAEGKPDSWQDRRFNTVSSFAAHASDPSKLWVGSFRGIYLFDKKSKKLSQQFEIITPRKHIDIPWQWFDSKAIDVSKMDVVNDTTIWFNSWAGGFGHYNTTTGAVQLYLFDAFLKTKDRFFGYVIRRFAKLKDGSYLLGVFDPHPGVFDIEKKSFKQVKLRPDVLFDAVRFVTNDREGNIWLLSKGSLYVSIPAHRRLKLTQPFEKNRDYRGSQLRGVFFDKSSHSTYGAVFHSNGVYVFDSNFVTTRIIPTPVVNNYYTNQQTVTYKIAKDGIGRWWTAGWENYVLVPGAAKFERAEKKFPALQWMKKKGEFRDIVADKKGNLLYKAADGSIYFIEQHTLATDTIRHRFLNPAEIEMKAPSYWYDSTGNYVYIVQKEGIAQFNLETKRGRDIPLQSLFGKLTASQVSCATTLDQDGRLWVMMPRYGIRIIDPKTLLCVDSIQYTEKGLIRGDYTDITGAEKPYIFLRSLNGIVVYDYIQRRSYLFDSKNGLSDPENISLLYANGNLVVGQRGTINYLRLNDLGSWSFDLKPAVNSITVDTTVFFVRGNPGKDTLLPLSYNHNTITFSFSAQEFLMPERIEYAYQLAGIDKVWQYTNSFNRKVTYSQLSPGVYTFNLKAQVTGGDWSAGPVSYTIKIVPAFWQRPGFKWLLALSVAGLFWLLYKNRVQAIRKKELFKSAQEKEMLELEAKALRSQMNPHFVFNSLNSIKSLINRNENEKAADYLTTFSKLIRTLFQNSDKREISLHEEMETCKLYAQIEKMRFNEKVNFNFETDETVDLKDIKVPALILQPFIENAIWHGLMTKESGGTVLISVKQEKNQVECIIDDDGIGRQESAQLKTKFESSYQSRGTSLTQSRLKLDRVLNNREDHIQIIDKYAEDGKPVGTKVILTFKSNDV